MSSYHHLRCEFSETTNTVNEKSRSTGWQYNHLQECQLLWQTHRVYKDNDRGNQKITRTTYLSGTTEFMRYNNCKGQIILELDFGQLKNYIYFSISAMCVSWNVLTMFLGIVPV
jgi:hypothetical protein